MAIFGEKGIIARLSGRDRQMIQAEAAGIVTEVMSPATDKASVRPQRRQPKHLDVDGRPLWGLGSQPPRELIVPDWMSHHAHRLVGGTKDKK